jgi:hypothetical protein
MVDLTKLALIGGSAIGAGYLITRRRASSSARLPKLMWLDVDLAIVRLPGGADLSRHCFESSLLLSGSEDGVGLSKFFTVSRTVHETSIVIEERLAPMASSSCQVETGWAVFKLEGPLDFALIGILSRIASALAANGISIFAISTYDTDYVLVKSESRAAATTVLQQAGYVFEA